MPTNSTKQRILSLDGGPALITYLRLLRELVRERPHFFDAVDLYAGTSAGSICALFFAKHPKGTPGLEMLDQMIHLADELIAISRPGIAGILRLLSGLRSIDSTNELEKLLAQTLNIDDRPTTLGDLPRNVTLVSFLLREPWRPKIYHNFNDDIDRNCLVTHVALSSSAFPIYYPIHEGHVDGGVFANNPGMCAIAQTLHKHHNHATCNHIEEITMLSLGGEDRRFGGNIDQKRLERSKVPWGWLPWILQIPNLLLLVDLLINADGKGVSYQCEQLLRDQFKRLAITTPQGTVGGFMEMFFGRGEALIKQADETAIKWRNQSTSKDFSPNFSEMLRWLDRHWFAQPLTQASNHSTRSLQQT